MIPTECIKGSATSRICVAKENGKEYRVEKNSPFLWMKIKIEDCVIKGTSIQKCDYLVQIQPNSSYFIELKSSGEQISEACDQIYSTINYLRPVLGGQVLHARIVGCQSASRSNKNKNVPDLIAIPSYRKLDKLVRPTGGNIKRESQLMIEKI
jgi:hypothetical protein